MCFSASASFAASGLLAVIGAVTISKAKKHYRMLAMVPWLFALQQFCDGLVWLSFVHTKFRAYQSLFVYSFLFFAFILWPIWIPVSVYAIESVKTKRKILLGCLTAGTLTALVLALCLMQYGAQASVVNHHIFYRVSLPEALWIPCSILYLIATVLPFFIVSLRWGWVFGITVAASYLATLFYYYEVMISVWCFFAALLSILLLVIIP